MRVVENLHLLKISIHAPTRGATLGDFLTARSSTNFNPRSYKRSDIIYVIKKYTDKISIHAPTRGATPLDEFMRNATLISIHAPTRGATIYVGTESAGFSYFNPRSYKRSD